MGSIWSGAGYSPTPHLGKDSAPRVNDAGVAVGGSRIVVPAHLHKARDQNSPHSSEE